MKKLLLSLGTLASIAAPIAAVVACSSGDLKTDALTDDQVKLLETDLGFNVENAKFSYSSNGDDETTLNSMLEFTTSEKQQIDGIEINPEQKVSIIFTEDVLNKNGSTPTLVINKKIVDASSKGVEKLISFIRDIRNLKIEEAKTRAANIASAIAKKLEEQKAQAAKDAATTDKKLEEQKAQAAKDAAAAEKKLEEQKAQAVKDAATTDKKLKAEKIAKELRDAQDAAIDSLEPRAMTIKDFDATTESIWAAKTVEDVKAITDNVKYSPFVFEALEGWSIKTNDGKLDQ